MVSIIKNQVLKHLSKFTKNLQLENIQLSTLKGRAELFNLELDEEVLMELLELPIWLRITKAHCNRVELKIHWTKLKSVPIHVVFDVVEVDIETCDSLRPTNPDVRKPSYSSGGKYSTIDQTIDGMTVVIKSVKIVFCSPAFKATFELQSLLVESRTPLWRRDDLRVCRLKDSDTGELLIFKYLEWETLRVEAYAVESHGTPLLCPLTPLRLITDHASCQIIIKKRLCDCSILGSRLIISLDQLVWALTDANLIAALHFVDSLSDLVKMATSLSQKVKALHKLTNDGNTRNAGNTNGQSPHQSSKSFSDNKAHDIFKKFDVAETSYHLYCAKINLHFCDDFDPENGRSSHPFLTGGGALQIQITDLLVDHYPFHLARGSREAWLRYREPAGFAQWADQLYTAYNNRLYSQFAPDASAIDLLMSSVIILRVGHFNVYQVATSHCVSPRAFMRSETVEKLSALLVEFAYYYFPGTNIAALPVPSPYIYAHFGPVISVFDETTVLWFNAFIRHVLESRKSPGLSEASLRTARTVATAVSVRAEILLPKLIVPIKCGTGVKECHLKATHITATNYLNDLWTTPDLSKHIDRLQHGPVTSDVSSFPWSKELSNDYKPITQKLLERFVGEQTEERPLEMPWGDRVLIESLDVWNVRIAEGWSEIGEMRGGVLQLRPFVDPLRLVFWLHIPADLGGDPEKNDKFQGSIDKFSLLQEASWYVFVEFEGMMSIRLEHDAFVCLVCLSEMFTKFMEQLAEDVARISTSHRTQGDNQRRITICMTMELPDIELWLILDDAQNQHGEQTGISSESSLVNSAIVSTPKHEGIFALVTQPTDLLAFLAGASLNDSLFGDCGMENEVSSITPLSEYGFA